MFCEKIVSYLEYTLNNETTIHSMIQPIPKRNAKKEERAFFPKADVMIAFEIKVNKGLWRCRTYSPPQSECYFPAIQPGWLSLVKCWSWVDKVSCLLIERPDQFHLAILPLHKRIQDIACAISIEGDWANYGIHIRGSKGISNGITVQSASLFDGSGQDLNAGICRSDKNVSRSSKILLMFGIKFGYTGEILAIMPASKHGYIITGLA
jgi:hypothetical protein